MGKNETTSKLVDEIIIFGVTGVALGTEILLPGIAIALEKPMGKFFKTMDKREKERILRRTVNYMRVQGYFVGDYEHGLQITPKARKRYAESSVKKIVQSPQEKWDKKWRVIIYDIPIHKDDARRALQSSLRKYGCRPLQKSAYITPFPCAEDIERLAVYYKVEQYVTYFEATRLSNEKAMIAIFKRMYPKTKY